MDLSNVIELCSAPRAGLLRRGRQLLLDQIIQQVPAEIEECKFECRRTRCTKGMFSYVSLEERVPQDHPLRAIRKSMDEVLHAMAKDFDSMYARTGRPSVPPERLLRAVLLQIFYTVRSERMLMEQMNC